MHHRISSLLVCHFLLALQEANQQSAPADGSLSFGRSLPYFDQSALPPFIAPLGGLIHTSFGLEDKGPGSSGSASTSFCDGDSERRADEGCASPEGNVDNHTHRK